MQELEKLLRPHILQLKPYTSARDEYEGNEAVFLDANENPFGSATKAAFNRYPDPYQKNVKQKIATIKNVPKEQIFLGNGSDEAIDLLFRAFCKPEQEQAIITPPTYGMYEVSAALNQVNIVKVPLDENYQLNVAGIQAAMSEKTKLLFLCSPNNPTGNALKREDMITLLKSFNGITIIDEAYIDYCPEKSLLPLLAEFPGMVVIQTLSKAWGMAAIRLGMAFAHPFIIRILNKIKPPYNISGATQELAWEALQNEDKKNAAVAATWQERTKLIAALQQLDVVEKVFPSDSNFLLVQVKKAQEVFEYLLQEKVIVRNRASVPECAGCLRITVGTPEENRILLEKLKKWESGPK